MPGLNEIGGSLSKKMGPLKAWQWGAVLGGGYLLYRVLKGKGVSLTGSSTAATGDTGTSGGSSGTSSGGTGTTTDTGYNPPNVLITIAPESVQPTATPAAPVESPVNPGGPIIPDTPYIDNSAALKKAQENTAAQHAWGEHWKQQAIKNAANASRSSGKVPATRKVATTATHKPKPVVQHPAKRNVSGIREIAPKTAAKKVHTPVLGNTVPKARVKKGGAK